MYMSAGERRYRRAIVSIYACACIKYMCIRMYDVYEYIICIYCMYITYIQELLHTRNYIVLCRSCTYLCWKTEHEGVAFWPQGKNSEPWRKWWKVNNRLFGTRSLSYRQKEHMWRNRVVIIRGNQPETVLSSLVLAWCHLVHFSQITTCFHMFPLFFEETRKTLEGRSAASFTSDFPEASRHRDLCQGFADIGCVWS